MLFGDSGDGFVAGADGTPRWGRHGAAGVLLVHDGHVFLAERARMTHNGGTWALPGGALHRDETPEEGALRELVEELGSLPEHRVITSYAAVDGTWTYTTVIAEVDSRWEPTRLSWETAATRWVPVEEVETMALHPGFRSAWPVLRELLAG
ncbi:MAG TPA: NUDIX hydrolase [Mycobacteriales bacterium]|nr:NUDIX hydrolase [Mycobacteriales bacterium]